MKKILLIILAMMTCIGFSACADETESVEQSPIIEFVKREIVLEVGKSEKVEVITPQKNVFVLYSVADTSIASISMDGTITGVAEGQTICYATFKGETVVCAVKVIPKQTVPMLSVSMPYEGNEITLYVGESIQIQLTARLGDTALSEFEVAYTVADNAVVSITGGSVDALKVGQTTVVVSVTCGEQSAETTLSIKVVEKT